MSPLHHLPTELLREICVLSVSGKDNEDCNKSLLALCLSCHQLRNVAQGILYRSVNVNLDDKGSAQPLWQLTEVITTQPRLASTIRILSIQLNHQASIDLAVLKSNLPSVAYWRDTNTRPRYYNAFQRLWAYELFDILIAQLPNVQNVYIATHSLDAPVSCGHTSMEVFNHIQNVCSTAILRPFVSQSKTSLRHVEITHRRVQTQTQLQRPGEFELSLFVLSWLESICIRKRQLFSFTGASLFPPAIASKLTSLELRECCINVGGLRSFFIEAHSLKRFAFVTIDPLSIHRGLLFGRSQFDPVPLVHQSTPAQILEALGPRADTLEDLEIDLYEWFQIGFEALWGYDRTDPKQRYISFRHFKHLKVLNIECERACQPTDLPESLLALTLTHRPNKPCIIDDPLYYPRIEQSYRKLILENICPRLQYVKVGRFYPFRYKGPLYFDWRYISERQWEAFVSCNIDFYDSSYNSAVHKAELIVSNWVQDTWWDVWWNAWFSASWPKDLKEDILKCLLREVNL